MSKLQKFYLSDRTILDVIIIGNCTFAVFMIIFLFVSVLPKKPDSNIRFIPHTTEEGHPPAYRDMTVTDPQTGNRSVWFLAYNGRTKTVDWTLEILIPESLGTTKRDGIDFFTDHTYPLEFVPQLNPYRNSGFARGHSAAAANHNLTRDSLLATMSSANLMPQYQRANDGPIGDNEDWCRATVRTGATIHRFTAPVWQSKDGKLTVTVLKDKTWVPTHVFISCLIFQRSGTVQLHSWLIPNEDRRDHFDNFLIPTNRGESLIGLDLWSDLPDTQENTLEAAL